jgi:hypothetical protein
VSSASVVTNSPVPASLVCETDLRWFDSAETTSAVLCRAIPAMDAAVRAIRQAGIAAHLLAAADRFSTLQDRLASAARIIEDGCQLPGPLYANYRAHLSTLSFELRRARTLLLQEHARLQSKLPFSNRPAIPDAIPGNHPISR